MGLSISLLFTRLCCPWSSGQHRLIDIGARSDKRGVVFDLLIHPKLAFNGFLAAGAAQHKVRESD